MTPEQFCYWLQGRVEMQPDNPPSPEEWKMIGEHLATVFKKVTPGLGIPPAYVPPKPMPNYDIPSWEECKVNAVNRIFRC